ERPQQGRGRQDDARGGVARRGRSEAQGGDRDAQPRRPGGVRGGEDAPRLRRQAGGVGQGADRVGDRGPEEGDREERHRRDEADDGRAELGAAQGGGGDVSGLGSQCGRRRRRGRRRTARRRTAGRRRVPGRRQRPLAGGRDRRRGGRGGEVIPLSGQGKRASA